MSQEESQPAHSRAASSPRKPDEDLPLVVRARGGDTAAFDELVKVLPGEADGSEDQDPPEDQDVSEAAKPTRKRPAKDGQ